MVPGDVHTRAHVVARGRPLHRRTGPSALRPPSPEHTARIGSEISGGVLLQPPTGPSYKRRRTQGAPGRRRRALAAAPPSSSPHRAVSTAGVRNASAASLGAGAASARLSYFTRTDSPLHVGRFRGHNCTRCTNGQDGFVNLLALFLKYPNCPC